MLHQWRGLCCRSLQQLKCVCVFQIAIWLTVTLAVWRWVAVCRPHSAPTLCTMVYARRVLLAVYLACPALATPTFLMYTVNEYPDDAGSKVYRVEFSSFALAHNELLKKVRHHILPAPRGRPAGD